MQRKIETFFNYLEFVKCVAIQKISVKIFLKEIVVTYGLALETRKRRLQSTKIRKLKNYAND